MNTISPSTNQTFGTGTGPEKESSVVCRHSGVEERLLQVLEKQQVRIHVSRPGVYKYTHSGPIPTEDATRKAGRFQQNRQRPCSYAPSRSQIRARESKPYVSHVMIRISIPGFQRIWV